MFQPGSASVGSRPGARPRVRPGPALKGFALLSAACAALAISHDHFLVALACAAGMLLLGIIFPLLMMADVRLGVTSAPARVGVGSEAVLRLSVRRGWVPVSVTGVDWLFPVGLRSERAPRSLPARPSTLELPVRAERRGVYSLSEIEARTSVPFGLALASRRVRTEARVIVWPVPTAVDPAQLTRVVSTSFTTTFADRGSGDGDVSGLRPYRRGDALRAVSWRQTARFGQVIVRERSGSSARRALYATLDTCESHYDEPDRAESFERAVSLFAGIVEACVRDGVELTARVDSAQFVLADASGCTAIFDALAAASLRSGSTDVSRGLVVGPRGVAAVDGGVRRAPTSRPADKSFAASAGGANR